MAYQPISQGPWTKGLVASNQPLAVPKGSFPRASNLVMMERGALTPCDGSGIINWFNGAVQNSQGRFMSMFLYEPTGVNPYYLVIAQAKVNLGAPSGLATSDGGAGGSLAINTTYYYKVTALDGVGGETVASVEASFHVGAAAHKVVLTWNLVPNAFGYNVYRSTATGTEILLAAVGLPAIQPNPVTATVTFTDDGSGSTAPATFNIQASFGAFIAAHSSTASFALTVAPGISMQIGQSWTVSGCGSLGTFTFNQVYTITAINGANITATATSANTQNFGVSSGGGTMTGGGISPPIADNTQQTVLIQMPRGTTTPIAYSNANIVAYFPATTSVLGQVPTGGTGGGGSTGAGINGQGSSTPSGGVAGRVGPLPQMKQFTNRVIMAMGNGFPPQIFADPTGSPVNPAFTGAVNSTVISGDQVILTLQPAITSGGFYTAIEIPVGSNVILTGMSNATLNGVFPVTAVVPGGAGTATITVRNPLASGASSTGTFTVSTSPINSTFVPAYPIWVASTAFAEGDIIVPATQPSAPIYLTCLQAGISGSSEPDWHTAQPAIGQQFYDKNIIWTVTALLQTGAPPPPGAGHIEVFAGSLWAFNTSPTNTANGLDGPCSLRMSNLNNPNTWNPVNQAFLDKDDGSEGMGLGKFTITAQGIPPEGSLIAFKTRVPYQIIGVFGANNFAIQPVSSDMGCLAPRSIQFLPGFGLARYCHLGIAVFDGWKDQIISEQIRPYLFPVNDFDANDIVVADANYLPLSWAAQTSNPPMYTFAMPIGNSGGQLTRMMLYDLVLKAWAAPVDLPFPVGCMSQVQPVTSNPLTILGGFNDGCLQRWQAGDSQWYTGGGASAMNVSWSLRTNTVASSQSSQRVWARMVVVRGTNSGKAGTITIQPRISTVAQNAVSYPIAAVADFDVFASIGLTGLRFDAIISGTVDIEIDGIDYAIEPRPFGVPVAAI